MVFLTAWFSPDFFIRHFFAFLHFSSLHLKILPFVSNKSGSPLNGSQRVNIKTTPPAFIFSEFSEYRCFFCNFSIDGHV